MGTDHITINLSCLKCGGVPMSEDDVLTDDSIVKCKSCGEVFGTYAEVKAKGMDTLKQHVIDKFKDVFKKH